MNKIWRTCDKQVRHSFFTLFADGLFCEKRKIKVTKNIFDKQKQDIFPFLEYFLKKALDKAGIWVYNMLDKSEKEFYEVLKDGNCD